jgi:hypothetical protein
LEVVQQIEQKKGAIIWETNDGMGFLYPHHLEQWWMSIGCKQAILLIATSSFMIFWIGKNATSFLGRNKIEELRWFPYPIWTGGC